MSTHLTVTPSEGGAWRLRRQRRPSGAAPPVYDAYQRVAVDPGLDALGEDLQSLLRPLLTTSFLLDDCLVPPRQDGRRPPGDQRRR